MAVDVAWVWVLEGFDSSGHVLRWVLPGLSDQTVHEHLGFVPGGLWPPTSALLSVLRMEHGVEIDPDDFEELLIGKEAWSGARE